MSNIGPRIKAIRGKRNQSEFGNMLGVDRTTVGSWEIGRHEPNLEILRKIADIGGVSMDWLCGTSNPSSFEDECLYRDPNWQELIKFCHKNNLQPDKIIELLKVSIALQHQV